MMTDKIVQLDRRWQYDIDAVRSVVDWVRELAKEDNPEWAVRILLLAAAQVSEVSGQELSVFLNNAMEAFKVSRGE